MLKLKELLFSYEFIITAFSKFISNSGIYNAFLISRRNTLFWWVQSYATAISIMGTLSNLPGLTVHVYLVSSNFAQYIPTTTIFMCESSSVLDIRLFGSQLFIDDMSGAILVTCGWIGISDSPFSSHSSFFFLATIAITCHAILMVSLLGVILFFDVMRRVCNFGSNVIILILLFHFRKLLLMSGYLG